MALLINGRFLARPVTGVERYGRMLLTVIAQEWPDSRVIVPKNHTADHRITALEVQRVGNTSGHIWEQLELPRALRKGDVLLSPANTGPLRVDRHVPVVHDLAFLHHPEWFSARFAAWYRTLIPRLLRRAERIITVSDRIREEIMHFYGVPAELLHIVPPYVDHALMQGGSEIPTGRPYVLLVGSLDPRKGIDRAIDWYGGLGAAPFDLVIVGRTHRAFAPLGIRNVPGVRLLSDVGDGALKVLYRHAIALIQPSRYEGFGLPVLEAIGLDCPVIASPLPVFKDQFGDAVCYVAIDDREGMNAAIASLLRPQDRQALLEKAHERALLFNRERTAQALHNTLDPLLG